MADNTTLPGTGDVIATDDIASVKYPRTKLTLGADGTNDGDVSQTNPLPVAGNLPPQITLEFTRPADTAVYAAGDAVSDSTSATTIQALAGAARATGLGGYIVGIKIETDKKTITPRFRIHFFNVVGATVAADNALFDRRYADISKRGAYWDMPAMTTAANASADSSYAIDMTMRIPYTCAATSLFFVLETLDVFTPANAQKISVSVFVDRN